MSRACCTHKGGELPFSAPITPHAHGLLDGVDLLVASFAIPEDSPEIIDAAAKDIPIISRAQLLGALMTSYKRRVGISGSHGKSSVTAMLASLLKGRQPTVLCGAGIGSDGFVLGSDELLVYEACEYRDAFLSTHFSRRARRSPCS